MKTQIGIAQGGDFSDNTMTFEIEGEMILCAGKYAIVPIEDYNQLVNNVVLDIVIWRCTKDLFMESGTQVFTKGKTYKKEKSNSDFVTTDDKGYSYCFENWKEFFIAI